MRGPALAHAPGVLHWIATLVSRMGYVGVGVLMALENVVLPLPSELIMPLAGYAAALGRATLWGVIAAGTIGSVVGALPLYWLGRTLGEARLGEWVDRHGSRVFITLRELERAQGRFRGNGFAAVTVAQLVPGVRGLISIPAGVARMGIALFVVANFIGTAIWCAVLACVGRALGSGFMRVHALVGPVAWIVLAVAVVGGIVWLVRRRRAAHAAQP